MKKYEYKLIMPEKLVSERRKITGDHERGSEVLIMEAMNDLGRDGWLISPMHNNLIGVREIDGRKKEQK